MYSAATARPGRTTRQSQIGISIIDRQHIPPQSSCSHHPSTLHMTGRFPNGNGQCDGWNRAIHPGVKECLPASDRTVQHTRTADHALIIGSAIRWSKVPSYQEHKRASDCVRSDLCDETTYYCHVIASAKSSCIFYLSIQERFSALLLLDGLTTYLQPL